jgi:membrane-bound inhibitor of C-type lysozyme
MRLSTLAFAVTAAGAMITSSTTAMAAEPPMNDFYQAFYTCDGGSFMVAYDSDKPTTATISANNAKKTYELKRTDSPTGVLFAAAGAKFWTDGKTATLDGAATPLKNCRKKG